MTALAEKCAEKGKLVMFMFSSAYMHTSEKRKTVRTIATGDMLRSALGTFLANACHVCVHMCVHVRMYAWYVYVFIFSGEIDWKKKRGRRQYRYFEMNLVVVLYWYKYKREKERERERERVSCKCERNIAHTTAQCDVSSIDEAFVTEISVLHLSPDSSVDIAYFRLCIHEEL